MIGICEGSKYSNYESWLKGRDIEIIRLGYKYNNLAAVEKCDGILLSGGDEVNPAFYQHSAFLQVDHFENVDERRDKFEWEVMRYVEEKQKPLLAICRGLQFVNVFFGGTLIPDIPDFQEIKHSKYKNGKDRFHAVTLDAGSNVYKMVGEKKGIINSGHHQCVSSVGEGLKVTAMSSDGVIEALEKKDSKGNRFFLLIQWHPERMEDKFSPFSKKIKQHFLEALDVQIERCSGIY